MVFKQTNATCANKQDCIDWSCVNDGLTQIRTEHWSFEHGW